MAAINQHRGDCHRGISSKNRRAWSLTGSIQNITSFFLMSHSFSKLCDALLQSVWVYVLGGGLLCVCVCVWLQRAEGKTTMCTKPSIKYKSKLYLLLLFMIVIIIIIVSRVQKETMTVDTTVGAGVSVPTTKIFCEASRHRKSCRFTGWRPVTSFMCRMHLGWYYYQHQAQMVPLPHGGNDGRELITVRRQTSCWKWCRRRLLHLP